MNKLIRFIYIFGSFCLVSGASSGVKPATLNNIKNISVIKKPLLNKQGENKTKNRIASIKIISNKGSREANKKILESIFLKPRSIFSKRDLESCRIQISMAYSNLYPSSSVNVKPFTKINREGLVELVFKVDVQDIKVVGIIIKGNNLISSKKIASLLTRKPSGFFIPYFQKSVIDLTEFSNSSELIKNYASSIGLFDFKVNSIYYEQIPNKTNAINIVIDVTEGNKYKFGSIKFKNNSNLSEIKGIIESSIVAGDMYNKSKVEYVINKISQLLIKKNLNNFKAKVSESKNKNSEISIEIAITEEKNTILDSLSFSGNFTIPDSIIRRKMKLSPGDPLSSEAIKNQENLLLGAQLFEKVSTSIIPLENDKVALHFSLEELQTKAYLGGSLKGDEFGLESSAKIPGFYGTASTLSASAYISRSPNIQLSISEANAFGLGVDLSAEIGLFRSYRWASLFGYPETISEFIQYLFNDKWYTDRKEFISRVGPFLEQNSNLESFKMPHSVLSNWKENYFMDTFENSLKTRFNIIIPGQNSVQFSVFANIRNFGGKQYGVPIHLETEIRNIEEKRRNKSNEQKLTDKELMKILEENTDNQTKALRLFKDLTPQNKYELGTSVKYTFSDSYLNTIYSYSGELSALTGTTSAVKFIGSCFLSQTLSEYAFIQLEGSLGLALSQSFIDNFTSDISGLKYGPIEMYRFTFLGGRKFLNLSGALFLNVFSSDFLELTLKNSISLHSIWDSGVEKNRLPTNLCRKRGWSKNSLDIAMDDFHLIPLASIGLIAKFNSFTYGNSSLIFSLAFNKPISKNPFIRYSPIDISFGFGNN